MLEIKYNNKLEKIDSDLNGFQLAKILLEDSKNVVALKINNETKDLGTTITKDGSKIDFITTTSQEGLEILRHSTAHLLSMAVKEIYSNVKLGIGPAIENGFYYDFDLDVSFSENDFAIIGLRMQEIIKRDEKFIREEWSKKQAIQFFNENDEKYKVELINEFDGDEIISVYKCGKHIDLCRGCHVPSTRYLKHFKLTKVAGAYWRGDSQNKMLQRIYGVAFDSKENLDQYFTMVEEAEKRDHKKICRAMDLAHFEPEFAPGAPFFHPNGLYIYNKLITHMREKQDNEGYIEVGTPRVMNRSLWETSGHWEKYGEHNYSGQMEDGSQFCIKPMNCPGGILIYKQGLKSYRDLPIKMAEFGKVNRYEASGALNGFLRVREFTQDDAHIFCIKEQMENQCIETTQFLLDVYRDFGFDNVRIKLSTRPEKRIGNEEIWDLSEKALADALKKLNLPFTIFEGEGAFYGPKLEFVLKDALGRDWQLGTIQLDMNLPERFDIFYIGEDGQKYQPVMLHRAILGSIERFMGIFIEHTEGKFPLWLNPLHICVATITDEVEGFAAELVKKLRNNGLRVELDNSSEKISYKIREASLKKIPYIFSIGKKEVENNTVNVRIFGSEKTYNFSINEIISKIKVKIENKEKGFEL